MNRAFSFFRAGGFNQVRFDSGADLLAIDQLDQKLWVALACPTKGLVFDPRTLALIDTDHDGRIRAGELIAAVKWAGKLLNNADELLRSPAELALSSINSSHDEGRQVLMAAKTVLQGLGKGDSPVISVDDTADALKAFNSMRFNGDGVITADTADTPEARALIEDILATVGGVDDCSGKPGINEEKAKAFFTAVGEYLQWYEKASQDTALLPLQDATPQAFDAYLAVRHKIDDFFVRCQIAAFDARAIAALNREEKEYYALTVQDLVITSDEIRRLPLAHVDAARPLPLYEGVNPAWSAAMNTFVNTVVKPLFADVTTLTEVNWNDIKSRFAPFEGWQASKVGVVVEKLGLPRLQAVADPATQQHLDALFAQEKAQEITAKAIASVEQLVRYARDIYKLATNFVSFQQFYQRKAPAIFQIGTLYLDQRACELCVRVDDVAKHSVMAPLSRAYLAYCDCTRPATGEKMTVAAAFTNGDSDNLMVGRNGIFYDRDGKDWDATIVRLVDNPISLRQAFWSPYKKLMRFVEDQVAKRAAASDTAANDMLAGTTTKLADAASTGKADAVAPKKFDVGVVAAIGVAVGGITAAFGAILQAFFGLGLWMPLGIGGILMLISGPSMLIAWLKLRQRNVGPLLDACGWAINSNALVNVPFGGSLTRLAMLPKGSRLDSVDPFAERKRPWKTYAILAGIVVVALCWLFGKFDPVLPKIVRSETVFSWVEPVTQTLTPAPVEAAKPAPAP